MHFAWIINESYASLKIYLSVFPNTDSEFIICAGVYGLWWHGFQTSNEMHGYTTQGHKWQREPRIIKWLCVMMWSRQADVLAYLPHHFRTTPKDMRQGHVTVSFKHRFSGSKNGASSVYAILFYTTNRSAKRSVKSRIFYFFVIIRLKTTIFT